MTSATLSPKTKYSDFLNLNIWSIKKHKALAIIYASLLLFSSPVIGTLSSLSMGTLDNPVTVVTFAILSTVVTMIMTFIIAVMMFDYLHNKRKADIFGALPCTRRTLFFSRYVTGLAMILVPYLLNMLIVMLLSLGIKDNTAPNSLNVFSCISYIGVLVIISVIASYSFTAFMAVCCGTTANTVLTTLLIDFAYPLAISMLSVLGSSIIPGVDLHIGNIPLISNLLSPYGSSSSGIIKLFVSLFGDSKYNFFAENWQQLVAWLLLIAASLVGCFFLTKKRKTEAAQNSFAFKAPSVIIRFIATAAIGLLIGLMFSFMTYFSAMTSIDDDLGLTISLKSNAWSMFAIFLISFVIAAFLTHLVATVIFNKGFRGFAKSLISLAAVVVCVCVLYTSLAFGGFGADKYVPQNDEISSVEITASDDAMAGMLSAYADQIRAFLGTGDYNYYSDKSITCSNEESISMATDLHKRIINNINTINPMPYYISTLGDPISYLTDAYDENYYSNPYIVKFVYHMKNGTTVERSYTRGYYSNIAIKSELNNIKLVSAEKNNDQLKALVDGENYEIQSFELVSDESYYYGYSYNHIDLPKTIDAIKTALAADIKANGTNFSANDKVLCEFIVYYTEKGSSDKSSMNIILPLTYTNTVTLLSQYGYLGTLDMYTNSGLTTDLESPQGYFNLPDNISKTKLKDSTVKVGYDDDDIYSEAAPTIVFDEFVMYDYEDEDNLYDDDAVLAHSLSQDNLYCRVVYADDDGNLYYYDDKYSDDEKFDTIEYSITLPYLRDKNDSEKVYKPYIIQLYTDDKNVYTTPLNVNFAEYSYCYIYVDGTLDLDNGNTYIYLSLY